MTRDELLTRAMGKEWHEWKPFRRSGYPGSKCSCGLEWDWKDEGCENSNPNFTTERDWTKALKWSQDDARVYVPQGGPEKWTFYQAVVWINYE